MRVAHRSPAQSRCFRAVGHAETGASRLIVVGDRDAQFVEMLNGYRRSGGIARERYIVERWRSGRPDRGQTPVDAPISFEWAERIWMPWFQFEGADLSVRPEAARLVAELSPVFDGRATASWLV